MREHITDIEIHSERQREREREDRENITFINFTERLKDRKRK